MTLEVILHFIKNLDFKQTKGKIMITLVSSILNIKLALYVQDHITKLYNTYLIWGKERNRVIDIRHWWNTNCFLPCLFSLSFQEKKRKRQKRRKESRKVARLWYIFSSVGIGIPLVGSFIQFILEHFGWRIGCQVDR